ncbi:MAG: AsmA family protein [Pseudohongiellaceae bacterium]
MVKSAIITAGALVLVTLLCLLMLPLLLNSDSLKQRLQASTANDLGLDLEIGGRIRMGLFPGLHITVSDMRFDRQGKLVASLGQVQFGLDIQPLLHREVRINSVVLQDPVILLERYEDGSYNFDKPDPRVALELEQVQVVNGIFHYQDARLDTIYEARACNLDLQASSPLTRDSGNHLADLDLAADFACTEVRRDTLTLTELNTAVMAQAGLVQFQLTSMQLLGAQGTGHLQVDFNGAVPAYQLSYVLPQFRSDELFLLLTRKSPSGIALADGAPVAGTGVEVSRVEGLMDLSATLTMQGQNLPEMKQTLAGAFALRGSNLVINGADLDARLARFEDSQNFNLVDVGAFMLAGPLGLVLTKGYDFANIFLETGSRTEIRKVISDWELEAGIAQVKSAIMETNENRIAIKGGLDIPGEKFEELRIALLDDLGCARVEQSITGTFQAPVINQPNVFWSLTGPIRSLLERLVPEQECEVFYADPSASQAR